MNMTANTLHQVWSNGNASKTIASNVVFLRGSKSGEYTTACGGYTLTPNWSTLIANRISTYTVRKSDGFLVATVSSLKDARKVIEQIA
jgi:hypothetical protein